MKALVSHTSQLVRKNCHLMPTWKKLKQWMRALPWIMHDFYRRVMKVNLLWNCCVDGDCRAFTGTALMYSTCPRTALCREAWEQPSQDWGGRTWRGRPLPGPGSPRHIPPAQLHSHDTWVNTSEPQRSVRILGLTSWESTIIPASMLVTCLTWWLAARRWTPLVQGQTCSLYWVQTADWFLLDLQKML